MSTINIGSKVLGPGLQPFVVAEVGINHNGELDRAVQMIAVAKEAGCDAVKFQTFRAEEFINDKSLTYTYKSQGEVVTESMIDMFKRYEFTKEEWSFINKECERVGIMFMSTPQNTSDLELLLSLGIDAIKIGSDDSTNIPLIKEYAKTGLPLVISTGMGALSEIARTVEAIDVNRDYPLVLLVCTSQYPTPAEDANLSKISSLMASFPEINIGFSDHTQGVLASAISVGLGATFVEKHFTLDNCLPGPDHWFSENPTGLKEWVDTIRNSYLLLGNKILKPTSVELSHKLEYQRRLVASKDIKQQQVISADDIVLRRVNKGEGFPPEMLEHLIGKRSPRPFKTGDPIEF